MKEELKKRGIDMLVPFLVGGKVREIGRRKVKGLKS
jgi:hypothetical protein